jgi:hypothetical protein
VCLHRVSNHPSVTARGRRIDRQNSTLPLVPDTGDLRPKCRRNRTGIERHGQSTPFFRLMFPIQRLLRTFAPGTISALISAPKVLPPQSARVFRKHAALQYHSPRASAHSPEIASVLIDCPRHISTRFSPPGNTILLFPLNLRSHRGCPPTDRFQPAARIDLSAALMSGPPFSEGKMNAGFPSRGGIGSRDIGTRRHEPLEQRLHEQVQSVPGARLFFPLKDGILCVGPRLQIGHKVQDLLRRIRNQEVHRHGRNH